MKTILTMLFNGIFKVLPLLALCFIFLVFMIIDEIIISISNRKKKTSSVNCELHFSAQEPPISEEHLFHRSIIS